MYPVAQTVVPRSQDGFWEWFAPSGVELLNACPPSGVVVGSVDSCAFPPSSDTPSLPSVVSSIPLPFYCLTNYQCAWCWRKVGGFCLCCKKGLQIFLDEGWEPLNHIFHVVLGFLVPTHTPFPACAERAWWRSVWVLLGLSVAVRSLCFTVPACFFDGPHTQGPGCEGNVSPFPRPCTALRTGDEAHVRALGAAVGGWLGGAAGCPSHCGRIVGEKPLHEWCPDLSWHRSRVEPPLHLPWGYPNVPTPKVRSDFLWFRRVCLSLVASYHASGGAGDHIRVGLDRTAVVKDWILDEEEWGGGYGYKYHVPFPSPDA